MPAWMPYSVSLARSNASSTSSNERTETTGPKTSSRQTLAVVPTSSSTTGARQRPRVDQRPHRGVGLQRVADPLGAGGRGQLVEEGVVDAGVDDHPLHRDARLAGEVERAGRGRLRG